MPAVQVDQIGKNMTAVSRSHERSVVDAAPKCLFIGGS
jgi:hypothetical protein